MSRLSPYSANCRGLAASAPCMQGRENVRMRALYASNTPPPSQLNGRNIGHSARRMRRVGRLSPKQYHNLTGRRVFALSSDGISLCRNHVEQEQLVCKTAAADSLLRQRSAYLYTACGKFYNSILKFVFFHASALLQSHNSTISYFHNFTISQFITVVKIEPINTFSQNAKAPTLSDRSLAPYRQSLTVGYEPFDGFDWYCIKFRCGAQGGEICKLEQ